MAFVGGIGLVGGRGGVGERLSCGRRVQGRKHVAVVKMSAGGGGPASRLFADDEWEVEVDFEEGGTIPWSAQVPNRDRGGEEDLQVEDQVEIIGEDGIILEDIDYDLSTVQFRDSFKCLKKVEWWDSPMKKTMREVRDMDKVEVMIEIRDMRLPRTGTHPLFRVWRREKNLMTVVIYTHVENFSFEEKEAVREYTMKELDISEDMVFFEDLRNCKKYRTKLLRPACAKIKELVLKSGIPVKQQVKKAIVVGVPNVGKSSFIYIVSKELIKKKKKKKLYHAPVVADHAGETIRTKSFWFNEKPNIMLIDTPGLFPPASNVLRDPEAPYKLAATKSCNLPAIARDFDFMQVEVADYILFKLNNQRKFYYVERYGLKGPTDHIHRVLNHMDGNTDKQNALTFVDDFNMGYLGAICFDELVVEGDRLEEEATQYELKPYEERKKNNPEPRDVYKKFKPKPKLTMRSDFWRDI